MLVSVSKVSATFFSLSLPPSPISLLQPFPDALECKTESLDLGATSSKSRRGERESTEEKQDENYTPLICSSSFSELFLACFLHVGKAFPGIKPLSPQGTLPSPALQKVFLVTLPVCAPFPLLCLFVRP